MKKILDFVENKQAISFSIRIVYIVLDTKFYFPENVLRIIKVIKKFQP